MADWILHCNNVSYIVKTDCHHPDYHPLDLKLSFSEIPVLKELVAGYMSSQEITTSQVLNCSEKLTYIAVVEGLVPAGTSKPIFFRTEVGNKKRWNRESATDETPIVITRDYLDYLTKEHLFQVTKIHSVYFYRKCEILGKIYKELLQARAEAKSPGEILLIKNVVNFCTGFFGFNPEKRAGPASYRLLQGNPSKGFNGSLNFLKVAGKYKGTKYWLQERFRAPKGIVRRQCATLGIYIGIVEFGKMRMAQIFSYLEKYLRPTSFRHLYSNTDNLIAVIGTKYLPDSVPAHLRDEFLAKVNDFFLDLPGHFKREWTVDQENEWKFASAIPMNWALITKDGKRNRNKNSAFNGVDSEKAFQLSIKMLKNVHADVPQERREDKMLNYNKKKIKINFLPKKN